MKNWPNFTIFKRKKVIKNPLFFKYLIWGHLGGAVS